MRPGLHGYGISLSLETEVDTLSEGKRKGMGPVLNGKPLIHIHSDDFFFRGCIEESEVELFFARNAAI